MSAPLIRNTLFDTTPLVVHAHGYHTFKPYWEPIKTAFFATPPRRIGPTPDLTVITWNNGAAGMGILERSLAHLGVPVTVLGQDIPVWNNAVHKPQLTAAALPQIATEFVLGIDSRDALLLGDPGELVARFVDEYDCQLLFAADLVNWPTLARFDAFESSLPPAQGNRFRYVNGGMWIGRTDYCRRFFAQATRVPPCPEQLDSEQGILKQMYPDHFPDVYLDYRCSLFQNIGFVFNPILDVNGAPVELEQLLKVKST